MEKPVILAIVGPTGTGKSETAIRIAQALGHAEIVSMDSMQVYHGLDIGTAKLPVDQQGGIPHHMLDVADPHEIYTVSDYKRDAMSVIRGMISGNRLPVLTGGTGLYLNALSYRMDLGGEGKDEAYRETLHARVQTEDGQQALYEELRQIDPESAAKLHFHDVRRVIRALEIYHVTGHRKSETDVPEGEPFRFLIYGLDAERAVLYRHLEERVDAMIAAGWLEEVRTLLDAGVSFDQSSGGVSQAIGYPELAGVLQGSWRMPDAIERIKRNTRRYAKRQWTWFRRDSRVCWFDTDAYSSRDALTDALLSRIREDLEEIH